MREIILCKFGEIALKGLNKSNFESVLVKNVRRRLKRLGEFDYHRAQSTLYVYPLDSETDMASAMGWSRQRLNKITNGKKVPDLFELDDMASALGSTVMDLAHIFLQSRSTNVD